MQKRHSIKPVDVVSKIKDDVRFIRGMGDSGIEELVVEFADTDLQDRGYSVVSCPHCDYDRAKVTHRVNPTMPEPYHYECMNPNCGWCETEKIPDEIMEKF